MEQNLIIDSENIINENKGEDLNDDRYNKKSKNNTVCLKATETQDPDNLKS